MLPHSAAPSCSRTSGATPRTGPLRRAIELLDRWPQLHLVTSMVWLAAYLRDAIARHPDRVLLGSDFPAGDPVVARTAIERLGLPAGDHGGWSRERTCASCSQRDPARSERSPTTTCGSHCFPRTAGELEPRASRSSRPVRSDPRSPRTRRRFWADCGVRSSIRSSTRGTRARPPSSSPISSGRRARVRLQRRPQPRGDREGAARRSPVGLDSMRPRWRRVGGNGSRPAGRRRGRLARLPTRRSSTSCSPSRCSTTNRRRGPGARATAALRRRVALLPRGRVAGGRREGRSPFRSRRPAATDSTGASYSWDLELRLRRHARVWRPSPAGLSACACAGAVLRGTSPGWTRLRPESLSWLDRQHARRAEHREPRAVVLSAAALASPRPRHDATEPDA